MTNLKNATRVRSLRWLLVLCLTLYSTLSLAPQAKAGAGSPFQAEIISATGHAGETVSMAVYLQPDVIEGDDSYWKYTLQVDYDPNVLALDGEITDEASSEIFDTGGSVAGSIQVEASAFGDLLFISERQKVMTLRFKINPEAAAGDTNVTLTGGSFTADQSPTEINSFVSGTVTVLEHEKKAEVTIGSKAGEPGTLVQVPVKLSDATTGVGSYGVALRFDKDALEVNRVDGPPQSGFASNFDNEAGIVQAGWADLSGGDNPILAGQDLFTVTFKIKNEAQLGDKAVNVADPENIEQFTLTDADAEEMVKSLHAGNVNVYRHVSSPVPPKEIIAVDVKGSGSDAVAAKAEIERTTKSDGTKSDKVVLTSAQAKTAIAAIAANKLGAANIMIPDAKDEVSEVNVTVPKEAKGLLADAKLGLGIVTDNVQLIVPSSSLEGFADDVHFRFVPIKKDEEKKEIKARADKDTIVQAIASDGVTVIGRPMTIETNLQNREVTLIMPLKEMPLSKDELEGLRVYIEHGDGTRELLQGKLVPYPGADGVQGIQFTVTKFSTFTLVYAKPKLEEHHAYVNGYQDGKFRPEQTITRAEMAAMLSRVITKDVNEDAATYADVPTSHWAAPAIAKVSAMQVMSGYPNNRFGPEKPITRAELAAIAAGLDAEGISGSGFKDIAGHWAENSIRKAQGAGLLQGYPDGSFKPEKTVTRAEAVTVLNRVLGRGPAAATDKESPWRDVAVDYWAYADIAEASVEHSFTHQADGTESWKH
ncbi:S-layer homology domain-containing protein [Paenibacillus sp. JDR-2]|uniref:S-layer homology domain-containing protein n=1 Tax=Paenibacillus sp. (strain JDR-2) TaxID=324057 RepID=UPI0001667B9A|nr:S-layer homology domain-containing protein [Paenibacillus sp. JDR-2]ACT02941.1 cellulosome anchoring protein cohesin region [Paenibacillus sp. JDR-2]